MYAPKTSSSKQNIMR